MGSLGVRWRGRTVWETGREGGEGREGGWYTGSAQKPEVDHVTHVSRTIRLMPLERILCIM